MGIHYKRLAVVLPISTNNMFYWEIRKKRVLELSLKHLINRSCAVMKLFFSILVCLHLTFVKLLSILVQSLMLSTHLFVILSLLILRLLFAEQTVMPERGCDHITRHHFLAILSSWEPSQIYLCTSSSVRLFQVLYVQTFVVVSHF